MRYCVAGLWVALVGIAGVACDRGGSAGSGDEVAASGEIADPVEVFEVVVGPCGDLPDLTGRVYRVTDFVATAPTDGINSTWKKWAETYDLVMMFRILDHDPVAGRLDAVVACGGADMTLGDDGEPVVTGLHFGLEPTPVFFALEGCDLTITTPLDIHLSTPWVSGEIPIQSVTGTGLLSEDGAEITRLDLSGYLGETTTAKICIGLEGFGTVNLHWFFRVAGICPDMDTDDDGVLDAYNFLGWIRAVDETPLFDAAVVPIETQVPECVPDEEPCVTPEGG